MVTSPPAGRGAPPARPANWAGNVVFGARRIASPTSPDELRALVTGADRVKVLGAGHSFSTVADTTGLHLTLHRMPAVYEVSADRRSVRVGGGMRLGELAERLHADGLALPVLPSLPHITLAGAVATGTHGSGTACRSLAGSVLAATLLTADGRVRTVADGDEEFGGVAVGLGAFGVVTELRLAVLPSFDVAQTVYVRPDPERLWPNLEEVLAAAYSVSVFTDWRGDIAVWAKRRTTDPPADLAWTGAVPATRPRHPIPGLAGEHCTTQRGVPGPWYRRLPHFRPEFTPSVGAELQSEYLVDRAVAGDAVRQVAAAAESFAPVLHVCELRAVAADAHWLSPCHGRASLAIHLTWRAGSDLSWPLADLERRLAPLEVRPHWGKLFTVDPAVLAARYPRHRAFARLRRTLDPAGTFTNPYLDRYLA